MHVQSILTINAACIAPGKVQKGPAPADLFDVPRFAAEQLGLRGLNLPVTLLRGMTHRQLETFRDRADRAHCPILVLVDETPRDFVAAAAECAELLVRFASVAQALGCGSIAMTPSGIGSTDALEPYGKAVKRAMQRIERMEINTLLRPGDPVLANAEGLAELVKKVGGFRIGALPSFSYAHGSGDLQGALRRLAPYASASIEASIKTFARTGAHKEWDLEEAVGAIRSVGYTNTLCIDYQGTADPVAPIRKAVEALTALLLSEDEAEEADDAEAPERGAA